MTDQKQKVAKVALAQAMAEAYCRNYAAALSLLQDVVAPENSALYIQKLMILYLASRGTGQSDGADNILQDFLAKTAVSSGHAIYRVYLADQLAVHFGDHTLAEELLQGIQSSDMAAKECMDDVRYRVAVLRGEVSTEDIIHNISSAKDLGPLEDWVTAITIQAEDSPVILKQIVDVLNKLKDRAPDCSDAIDHRISYAQEKLKKGNIP